MHNNKQADTSKWVYSISLTGIVPRGGGNCGSTSMMKISESQFPQNAIQMPERIEKVRDELRKKKMPLSHASSVSVWEKSQPLTCGQSSPSSGVISVSLCTTTLVTDMSGCCSLASLIA